MNADVGVYQIRCKRNGYVYIGGAERSIMNRDSCHRAMLRAGKHHSRKLQAHWNKFGEKAFVLEILEHCSKRNVRRREQYYLDLNFDKRCYNSQPNSKSAIGAKRDPSRHESRSESAKQRCTKAWRKAVSERVKKQHAEGKFGRSTWSPETKITVSMKLSAAFKGRTGKLHPSYGRHATMKQRKNYRQGALERGRRQREERIDEYFSSPASNLKSSWRQHDQFYSR